MEKRPSKPPPRRYPHRPCPPRVFRERVRSLRSPGGDHGAATSSVAPPRESSELWQLGVRIESTMLKLPCHVSPDVELNARAGPPGCRLRPTTVPSAVCANWNSSPHWISAVPSVQLRWPAGANVPLAQALQVGSLSRGCERPTLQSSQCVSALVRGAAGQPSRL